MNGYSRPLFEGDPDRALGPRSRRNVPASSTGSTPGPEVLEIGCGWGGCMEAAAQGGLGGKALEQMKMHAQSTRSLVKAATFRGLVVCSDFTVVFLLTHRWDVATGLVFATNLASTSLYFLHERIWDKIQWGRTGEPASHVELIQAIISKIKTHGTNIA